MSSQHFADRLSDAVREKNSCVVVGLDPDWGKLPAFLRSDTAGASDHEVLEAQLKAIRTFCYSIVEATAATAAAYKPQIAFFERYGSRGIALLEDILRDFHQHIFIVDCKRGDIGSTCEAYARAYFSEAGSLPAPLDCDAVTHNAYLGRDSIEPYMGWLKRDRGMFVLAKTSNPSSEDFQDRDVEGRPLFEQLAAKAAEWGNECIGEGGYSSIGLVVGATYPEAARQLRQIAPRSWFLAPGIGAQGGSANDAAAFANGDGLGALFAFSRGIIYAVDTPEYKGKFSEQDFALAAAQAAQDYRVAISSALGG